MTYEILSDQEYFIPVPLLSFRQMMEQQQQQQMQAHMERERRSSNSGARLKKNKSTKKRLPRTLHAVFIIEHHIQLQLQVNMPHIETQSPVCPSRFSFPRTPCRALRGPASSTSPNEHGWSSSPSASARSSATFGGGTPAPSSSSTPHGRREPRGRAPRPDWSRCHDRRSQTAPRSESETPQHNWIIHP